MGTNRAERRRRAGRTALWLAAAAVVSLPATPAWAHVTGEPPEQLPGLIGTVGLRVPHGCGASPTNRIDVAIPEGVEQVEPQPQEGWEVSTGMDPAGTRVTRVTWAGGRLAPEDVRVFTLKARLPDRPGTRLWFKTVQSCERGQTRWVQIPRPGERVEDLPHPAAWVDLVAPGRSRADREVAAGRMLPLLSLGGMTVLAAGTLLAVRPWRRRT